MMDNFNKTDSLQVEDISKLDHDPFYSKQSAHRGALLEEEERQLTIWQSAKAHKFALLICCIPFCGASLYGYDSIVNGATLSMPAFLLYFGDIDASGAYLPSIWTSLWNAMSLLCQAVGAFFIGFITDKYGRKWPACCSAMLTIAGTAMQYTADSRGLLLGGKMVNGFGIGAVTAVSATYASEIAPLKLKGPVQQALVLFYVFMMALGLGVIRIYVPDMSLHSFRTVFAIQWAVGGLTIIAYALAPESPNYLIAKGQLRRAHKVMSLLHGKDNSIDDRLTYLNKVILEEHERKESEAGSYIDCFKGPDLRRTLTVIFLYTAQNWGGAALLAQSIYFLIIAGLPSIHAFDVSIGGFALSLIIIVLSWLFNDKASCRNVLLVACVLNFLIMLVIGVLYYVPGDGAVWGIAVLMNVLISFQTSLFLGMGYRIAADVASYRLRAKTLSVGVVSQAFIAWLTQFTVPYMYNVDSGNLGARTGFVFAGFSVLLIAGTWFIVPETTNLTAAEIDQAYKDHVPVRKFQSYIRTSQTSDEP
ncbi:MFS general substrate transporter [Penicillium cataractarum]|uniref:MFS general substrate transporter n=1 Tax=Penicillium cataractarum TaxID=2100454 RepID=A0A9W9VF13_9EURO|nr:MFS general substrate transporter [Penicillium cataractarum]KAJ5379718.1 MFS general substrate transporter [Penicillium cataractarum]